MNSPLIQQLCDKISQLQQQNQQLRKFLKHTNSLIHHLCQSSGLLSFQEFVLQYDRRFAIHNQDNNQLNRKFESTIRKIEQKLMTFELEELPSIQQNFAEESIVTQLKQNSMKSVEKSQSKMQQYSRATQNQQQQQQQCNQLSDIEKIVYENNSLRGQIKYLKNKIREYKQSLLNIISLLNQENIIQSKNMKSLYENLIFGSTL